MYRLLFSALCAGACVCAVLQAPGQEVVQTNHGAPPACPPGCQVVEEICFKDVCRFVPDVRQIKKWVYSCKEEPFCVPSCRGPLCAHHQCNAACPTCDGPYHRNLLVKREIIVDEVCAPKCVVEKVPYKVYRIVPCGTVPPGTKIVSVDGAPPAATATGNNPAPPA